MSLTIDQMIAKGMGRSSTLGTFSSGVAGGGAAAIIDLNRPRFACGIPSGHVIRPFRITCQVQPGAATTDADETEILFAVDSLGMWKGDGAHTVEIPSNMRTDLDKGSAMRCGSIFAGDMTTTPGFGVIADADPVLDMELAREVQTLELTVSAISQNLYLVRLDYEPDNPPFIVGPATLLVYFGGTQAVVGGFAQIQWVEGRLEDFGLGGV